MPVSEDTLKFAVPAIIIALALIIVIGYYVLRYMRGSIKIKLAKNSFRQGEQITGSFDLITRKEIIGNRLYAALIGQEVWRERRGDSSTKRYTEVYRDEVTIEEAKTFSVGQATYDFQLPTPSSSPESDMLESGLGKTIKTGMKLLSGTKTYMQWTVEVRLDAQGLDLVAKRKIRIIMSD